MLRILHPRADTTDARVQQLADATDDRLCEMEERMTDAELAGVPDDRTAQTVQKIHDEQELFKQRMEHQQKQQAAFQIELQTRLDNLKKATKSAATKEKAERTHPAAPPRTAAASSTIATGEVYVVLGGFQRDSTAEVTTPAARTFHGRGATARRLLPLGSVSYYLGWLLAPSVTLAAPDLETARRIISELRTARGDTIVKTDNFEGRMYATLQKTAEERRHNRRLVAMAKVLQAAALPQQAFTKVPPPTRLSVGALRRW